MYLYAHYNALWMHPPRQTGDSRPCRPATVTDTSLASAGANHDEVLE